MSEVRSPSSWFTQQLDAVRECSRLGPVIDLACGRGRHCLAAAQVGLRVVGLDRNPTFLTELSDRARRSRLHVDAVRADFEMHNSLPLTRGRCGTVLVFRYLHRPLADTIAQLLAPGGLLVYETFTTAQRALGFGPSRDAFLLEPGELPTLFPGLETLVAWEGLNDDARPAEVARLVARRPQAGSPS